MIKIYWSVDLERILWLKTHDLQNMRLNGLETIEISRVSERTETTRVTGSQLLISSVLMPRRMLRYTDSLETYQDSFSISITLQ
jgi:hypothetical protein